MKITLLSLSQVSSCFVFYDRFRCRLSRIGNWLSIFVQPFSFTNNAWVWPVSNTPSPLGRNHVNLCVFLVFSLLSFLILCHFSLLKKFNMVSEQNPIMGQSFVAFVTVGWRLVAHRILFVLFHP